MRAPEPDAEFLMSTAMNAPMQDRRRETASQTAGFASQRRRQVRASG